jgi:hypothetical protein
MTDFFDPTVAPLGDPVTIIKGRHLAWRRLIDVDSALFSLKYVFQPRAGGVARTVTGSQSGAYWTFELTGAASVSWVEGDHAFDVVVVRLSDSEEAFIAAGACKVFTTTSDRRSHAEIMVEKIESIIQGRADNDVESYSIGSRSITKMSIPELTRWRDYYQSEIGESTAGGRKRNKVKVGFV